MKITPLSGPHTHTHLTISSIMMSVMMALLPATLFSLYLFGWPAINLFVITLGSAVLFEAACLALAQRAIKPALFDGSALLTAWLLALSLPPWAPWWIGVMGSACAIILGKQVFGGLGQNLFNPAMLARVILLISFPVQMTLWVHPTPIDSANAPTFSQGLSITLGGQQEQIDSVTTASMLGHLRTELTLNKTVNDVIGTNYTWGDAVTGTIAGSLGEASAILLTIGGLFLIWRRIITWHMPAVFLGSLALIATLFSLYDPARYASAQFHLLHGGVILAAFFILTDPVTSPSTPRGQTIFAIGCAILVYAIRTWGSYPEAVAFVVMLMNACTPLIDYYIRPRIYGRNRSGEPLTLPQAISQKGEEKK